MKRIYFCSQFFPPPVSAENTGGTISNLNMLRFLASRYDVTVLTFDPSSQIELFADEPFQVVQQSPPRWRALGLLLHWQDFVRRNTQCLFDRAGCPDILIATTSTLAAFDVADDKTKCIAVVRAFENFGFKCPWVPLGTKMDLVKGAILRRLSDWRLLRRADGILTNSRFMGDAISQRFGIKRDQIHILKQQVDFEHSVDTPPKNTIGFVHRGKDKNIDFVVDLAQRAPSLTFRIYGHAQGIPSDLPANVEVIGWASDRSEMFSSAALWLVPSLWAEPFGRVSIEAQAANRAVLVVNSGGLPETVCDERYVIDGFNQEAWLDRIYTLLALPDAQIAQAGAEIRSSFSKAMHDSALQHSINKITKTLRIEL